MADDTELESGPHFDADRVLVRLVKAKKESLASVPYPLQDEVNEDDVEGQRDNEDGIIYDATYNWDSKKKLWVLTTSEGE